VGWERERARGGGSKGVVARFSIVRFLAAYQIDRVAVSLKELFSLYKVYQFFLLKGSVKLSPGLTSRAIEPASAIHFKSNLIS
jgi:hypothetical protein